MPSSTFREWVIRPSDPEVRRALICQLGVHPLTAAVLVARGRYSYDEARAALSAQPTTLPDPFLLNGMEQAVDRLHRAIQTQERVMIYGDYDVDGTSATAVYLGFLKSCGLDAAYYIPDRLTEGYGLNSDAIRRCATTGVSLLITVDCGTTSHQEITVANSLGMDVIVTDHHLPHTTLPPALAVLNPCREDGGYPFSGLCSAGLAYKAVTAYAKKYDADHDVLQAQLDLVALATVADLAPMEGENRWLVQQGLQRITDGHRLGIRVLKNVASLQGSCSVGTIGFQLAPRINAAGRLGDAKAVVRLMMTQDEQEALDLARVLDRLNRERQQVEGQTLADAVAMIESEGRIKSQMSTGPLVLASSHWHPGVVGIVAGRVVERYHRPAVVIALNSEGLGRGSARSISGINICDAIQACREHLVACGGHAAAAGLTIREEALSRFRERLTAVLHDTLQRMPGRRLVCDAEVEGMGLTPTLVRELEQLGPFGIGNPEPTVVLRQVRVDSARVVGHDHLKLQVRGRSGPAMSAIGFGMGSWAASYSCGESVDLAGVLEINKWNGSEGLQLRLKDLRVSQNDAGVSC